MEFVLLVLRDFKRTHVNFYYLQYTGNEDAIRKLQKVIQLANLAIHDEPEIELSDSIFTEAGVDEHIRLQLKYTSFHKVTGRLELPWTFQLIDKTDFHTFRDFVDAVWDEDSYKNPQDFVDHELYPLEIFSWFKPSSSSARA
jgi:hypothetical protein